MLPQNLFEAEKLTDTITRIRMPGSVFSYIVKGTDRAAVIDTGWGIGAFRQYVEVFLDGMPYDLILTHGHFDHAGGAAEFDKVWLNSRDIFLAGDIAQEERRFAAMKDLYPQATLEELVPTKVDGYTDLPYGTVFDLGGEKLEIVCLGGHTPGSVGILFQNARILLAGDACCSFTLLYPELGGCTVREYLENLEQTWSRYRDSFDTVLYSHPHNYGGPEVFPQMIALCREILEGKDDHIPHCDMGHIRAYTAKALDDSGRRADGKIANLSYTLEELPE